MVTLFTPRELELYRLPHNDETSQNFEIRQEKIRATFHLIKS